MNQYMIDITDVGLTIRGREILHEINVQFECGKIYGLVGRNGSGKTMLMKCICGFVHACYIGWCVAAGSFFWTAILLWKKRSIYEEQVTEMTNSVIAIEDATLRCYQAVGNVYESCWIHFSDITDVIFNKKKQAFLIQITEDPKRKSEICVNSILVEENLFEVRGGNYKLDEFLKIFQKVIPYGHSNQRIDIELVRKQWETDMRMKHFYQWFPWSILGVIVIMQIL